MKHLIIIAALIASAPAHAERFGFGIDPHSVGGWSGSQTDTYTPSNPSPGRGGTYDGDDGYLDNGLFGQRNPVRDPLRYSTPQPLRGWGQSFFRRWKK